MTSRDGSLEKVLDLPFDGFDELLQALTDKNGYMITPSDLERGKLILRKS